MTAITRAKLAVAAMAVLLFIIGARTDTPLLRWTAIGLLLVAFLLRFYRPRA